MPDLIDNAAKLSTSSLFRSMAVALCFALAGCSATKVIELEPIPEKSDAVAKDPIDKKDEFAAAPYSAAPYSEGVVGTVSELYGEDSELEQSESYHDAVADNPLLRYIIIYFDFNSVSISPESQEVLREHANHLTQHGDIVIRLEGHADKRGSSGYNLSLGERRALAVQNFFQDHGLQETQTSAISYGEERPAVEGNNESAYAKNRRVELIYR